MRKPSPVALTSLSSLPPVLRVKGCASLLPNTAAAPNELPPCTKAFACPVVAQLTMPSAAMAVMKLPALQVEATRRCRYVVSAAMVPLEVMMPPVKPVLAPILFS